MTPVSGVKPSQPARPVYPSPATGAGARRTGLPMLTPGNTTPLEVGQQYYVQTFPSSGTWVLCTVHAGETWLTNPAQWQQLKAKAVAVARQLSQMPALKGIDFMPDGGKVAASITWKAAGGVHGSAQDARLEAIANAVAAQRGLSIAWEEARQASYDEDHE